MKHPDRLEKRLQALFRAHPDRRWTTKDPEILSYSRALARYVLTELEAEGVDRAEAEAAMARVVGEIAEEIVGLSAAVVEEAEAADPEHTDGVRSALALISRAVGAVVAKARGTAHRLFQQAAGVERYRWVTRLDDRVRPAHAELHGQVFSWEDEGPDGHPGDAYNCRCSARPVT